MSATDREEFDAPITRRSSRIDHLTLGLRRRRRGFFSRVRRGFSRAVKALKPLNKIFERPKKDYNKECWFVQSLYSTLGATQGTYSIAQALNAQESKSYDGPRGVFRNPKAACAKKKPYDGPLSRAKCIVASYNSDRMGTCSQCLRRPKPKAWCFKGLHYLSEAEWDAARARFRIAQGDRDALRDALLPYYDLDDDKKLSSEEIRDIYDDINDYVQAGEQSVTEKYERHCAIEGEACMCPPKQRILIGSHDTFTGQIERDKPTFTYEPHASGTTQCTRVWAPANVRSTIAQQKYCKFARRGCAGDPLRKPLAIPASEGDAEAYCARACARHPGKCKGFVLSSAGAKRMCELKTACSVDPTSAASASVDSYAMCDASSRLMSCMMIKDQPSCLKNSDCMWDSSIGDGGTGACAALPSDQCSAVATMYNANTGARCYCEGGDPQPQKFYSIDVDDTFASTTA